MKKVTIIGLIVLVLMFTGCSGSSQLIGKWESFNTNEKIEVVDSEVIYWDGQELNYELKEGKFVVDWIADMKLVYDYSLENGVWTLVDEDGDVMSFVKEDELEKSTDEATDLLGEWGIEYEPLFTFKEDKTMLISNFAETEEGDNGKYKVIDGHIKYVTEEDGFTYGYNVIKTAFFNYRIEDGKMYLDFIHEDDKESFVLSLVDTDEVKADREEAYQKRLSEGKLLQEELDVLEDTERKQYIKDKILMMNSFEFGNLDDDTYNTDVAVGAKNTSARTVDYLDYKIALFNKVGDVADTTVLNYVGPVEAGADTDDVYWDNVTYESTIESASVYQVTVEYADGDTITVNAEDFTWSTKPAVSSGDDSTGIEDEPKSFADIFNMTYAEIINYYGSDYNVFDYAGGTFLDYSNSGSTISLSIGFSLDGFSSSSSPVVMYDYDIDSFGTALGIEGAVTPDKIINVWGTPDFQGYDEMGELGYLLSYTTFDPEITFICNDEFSVVTVIELRNQ